MEIRLNESEIRQALSEAIASRMDYTVDPKPEECWFSIKNLNMSEDNAYDVEFCYSIDSDSED